MGVLLSLILLVIFVACIGFLYTEGMWSNALRLINVVTAGLLAMNFYEPLAEWARGQADSFNVLWDYLCLWALFVLFMVLFRTITDRLSRVNVRFLQIVDRIGGLMFAALVGWVLVCFTLASLHTAPLGKNFFFEAFQPGQKMFLYMFAPDQEWLGFTQYESDGVFCRSTPQEFPSSEQFIRTQSERRTMVEKHLATSGKLRVNAAAAK